MNTRHLSIALTLLASAAGFSAHAADLTRAQVQAEAARALQAGELDNRGDTYMLNTPVANTTQGVSRAQVVAERDQAIAAGELSHRDDTYQLATPAATGPSRSRAEVRAELARAVASGELERRRMTSYGYDFPAYSTTGEASAVRAQSNVKNGSQG